CVFRRVSTAAGSAPDARGPPASSRLMPPDRTPYLDRLEARIRALGGLFNAHLHIDRAETLDATLALLDTAALASPSSLSLSGKHALIPLVHASDLYDPAVLEARVSSCVERLAALGTAHAHSVVDVTD